MSAGAALIKSKNPDYTVKDIKEVIIEGANKLYSLNDYVKDSSRLNIKDSLERNIKKEKINNDYNDEFVASDEIVSEKEMKLFSSTKTIKISVSDTHILALKDDGTVWAWGDNTYGELGNGSNENSYIPRRVKGIDNADDISAGEGFSLALSDNKVYSWGRRDYGQLGIGKKININIPEQVLNLGDEVIQISAGKSHALALLTGGDVYAWGYNGMEYCSLGIGNSTISIKEAPVRVRFGNGIYIDKILAGDDVNLAIDRNENSVWSWGAGYGLGQGENVEKSNIPHKVEFLNNDKI